MTFTIFGGSSVDITVGKVIQVVPGYLPSKFDGALLPVVRVDESGPYVALEPSMISATKWFVNLFVFASCESIVQPIPRIIDTPLNCASHASYEPY
jgi:hypothetical protein